MALQLYLTSSSLLYIHLPFTIVNHYTTTITKRHHQPNVRDFTQIVFAESESKHGTTSKPHHQLIVRDFIQIFLLNLNRSVELAPKPYVTKK